MEAIVGLFFLGVFGLIVISVIIGSFLKEIKQSERGIVLTMGKYSSTRQPGWTFILPIFQVMHKVDIRIKAVDVPEQETITKDNIPVGINAVIYYRISESEKAILDVENCYYATLQLAQITMRNLVGTVSLDDLLKNRDKVSEEIQKIVDDQTDDWGIKVINVDLKDIVIPNDLKRTIAKEAEAEREKRAQLIRAEGEVQAAVKIAEAAAIMVQSPGALHMRTLQSINDISSDQSNTTIWMVPIEVLKAVDAVNGYFSQKK